jgi:hypothetical protein
MRPNKQIEEQYPLQVFYHEGRVYDYDGLRRVMGNDASSRDIGKTVQAQQLRDGTYEYVSPVDNRRYKYQNEWDLAGKINEDIRIQKKKTVVVHGARGDYARSRGYQPYHFQRAPERYEDDEDDENPDYTDWLENVTTLLIAVFTITVMFMILLLFYKLLSRM